MIERKKLQQIADDLGEPRKSMLEEAFKLLDFYMRRTGEMFAEIEQLKKQVNDKTQKLAQVIGERDDALNGRDVVVKYHEMLTKGLQLRGKENNALKATVERLLDLTDRCDCKHESCRECSIHKEAFEISTTPQQNLAEHDKELLTRFTMYLSERCDLNVDNMVRPFLDQEGES